MAAPEPPAPRPRDRLGRPLTPAVDSTGIDTSAAGSSAIGPPVADVTSCSDTDAWRIAVDYADAGLPFHAHEVCESRWRISSSTADRHLWKALAQWGAALTHEARGNAVGARSLAGACSHALAGLEATPGWVDLDRVRADCDRLKG